MDLSDQHDQIKEDQLWATVAIRLSDRLIGRDTEVVYEFEEFELDIPNKIGEDPTHAHWGIDGTVRIATHKRE